MKGGNHLPGGKFTVGSSRRFFFFFFGGGRLGEGIQASVQKQNKTKLLGFSALFFVGAQIHFRKIKEKLPDLSPARGPPKIIENTTEFDVFFYVGRRQMCVFDV